MKTKEREFIDISFDLSKNIVTGDIKVLKNNEAIKNSVKNLILTKIGERLLNKYIGTRVSDYLFELDTFSISIDVKEEIERVVNTFEPRIYLRNVLVNVDIHEIIVTIEYLIIGEPSLETLEFILLRES